MKKLLIKIRKHRKLFLSSTIVFSRDFGVSMVLGYITAKFIAGPRTYVRGRLPSITFDFKKYHIHLHHWLVFLVAVAVSLLINFVIFTPNVFYGFFGGVIHQGIAHYDDWAKII